jgi:hypothetical protein
MRDIRDDLRERANMLEEQFKSADAQFQKFVEQLKAEHDAKLKDLRSELDAVNVLLGIEQRRHGGAGAAPVAQAPAQAQAQRQTPPQQPLADFLIRLLSERGPMSKEEIQHVTLQEGYFADGDAERGVHAVLMHVVKTGHVRQLPNGDFAEVIRLRRAM